MKHPVYVSVCTSGQVNLEGSEGWMKLQTQQLRGLYNLPSTISDEMGGACGMYRGVEMYAEVFVGEASRKVADWKTRE